MSDNSQEKKGTFVPRITQLDANEFDKEIHNVLSGQLMEVTKYLKPGALNNIKHEINLVLDLLIFYYSVVMKNATFGQELLSLKYKNLLTKNEALAYAVINFILPYIKNKYDSSSSRVQNATIRNSVTKLELFVKILNFCNGILFLREGKYPTVCDRFLRLTYMPINKINQPVGYNYMTRELLWHGFMELLMNVLPLINSKAVKRKIMKPFVGKSTEIKSEKDVLYNSETKCAVCDDFPTLPCKISVYCPHVACYYCLKSNLLADEKFLCPICGETNTVNNEQLKFLTG